MRPYDTEAIFLGLTLRYGETSGVGSLTPDCFIFSADGQFGAEHSEIWKGIKEVTFTHRAPTLTNVADYLGASYTYVLRSLVDRLTQLYHIYDFDAELYQRYLSLVNKQGTVYRLSQAGYEISKNVIDEEVFTRTVEKIDDIDEWASGILEHFRFTQAVSGYRHISEINAEVRERWNMIADGDYLPMLDCGLPTFGMAKLFPRGKMAVIHGLSGSGKSSLVFQINVGTAIGLVLNDIPGCVAINSLEMEHDALVEKIASYLSGVDVSKLIDRSLSKDELERLTFWSLVADRLPIFIDDTNFLTTSALQYRASGLHVSSHGPVVQLATDYGELFDDDGDSEEQRVNHVFRQQFRLARMINASVLAISQSTHDKSLTGRLFIAGPDGTRYSRGVLQATDILIELWNPPALKNSGRLVEIPKDAEEKYSLAHPYCFIQKYRGGASGVTIPLGWKPESTSFFDLAFSQEPGHEIIFSFDMDHLLTKVGMKEEVESW